MDEAAKEALDESLELLENGALSLSISSLCSVASIELSHFEHALSKIKPSVSEQVHDILIIMYFASPSYRSICLNFSCCWSSQQRKHYEALSRKYSAM